MSFREIESHLEKMTELTVNQIRDSSLEDFRAYLENRNKKKITFTSEFPSIGRGNILRDSLYNSEELNNEIDKIVR